MSKLENDWRDNTLRPLLDQLPMWYFLKEALNIRGLPDIMGVCNGRFFALEVKRSGSELSHPRTVLQNYVLNKIKTHGGFAEFIYPENAEEVLSSLVSSSCKAEQVPISTHLILAYFQRR